MTFSEKLNLIMNITNTTNSILARAISIDPSLVSRLRRGDRTPSKNQNYIRAMSEFFARNCTTEYQKAALREMLQKDLPGNDSELTALIDTWFLEDIMQTDSVANFIDSLTNFQFRKVPNALDPDSLDIIDNMKSDETIFYGTEGKRNAVIKFLSLTHMGLSR